MDELIAAGATAATRDRHLATLKALYTHLTGTGLTEANPAAVNRRRLGLTHAGETSSTVTLTAAQVRALFDTADQAARGQPPGRDADPGDRRAAHPRAAGLPTL